MNDEKNYTRLTYLVIILVILVLGLGGYVVWDKFYAKSNSESLYQVPENNNDAQIQELISKSIFGVIVDINNDNITIKITKTDTQGKETTEEKTIKITSDTLLQKSEVVDEKNKSYKLVEAQISDFQKGDNVNILLLEQNGDTAEQIEKIELPSTE